MAKEVLNLLETDDIQGLVFSGYGKQRSAVYLFFAITDLTATTSWLKEIAARVTHGGNDRERKTSLNIAISYEGLQQLKLSSGTLSTFPRPFVEGMSQPDRARLLGDSLSNWKEEKGEYKIHLLLMLFAEKGEELTDYAQVEKKRAEEALRLLFEIGSEDLPARDGHLDSEEHFGFVDGIAQPAIAGYHHEKKAGKNKENEVKAGEFVLGYENEYGQFTDCPQLRGVDLSSAPSPRDHDLGRNGTYLVVRQIEQHVAAFWTTLRDQCRNEGGQAQPANEEELAARIVGRWRNGTPMTLSDVPGTSPDMQNDFGYGDDKFGTKCPIGAHVRRANPRDTLLDAASESIKTVKRHRLLRRGRPYGPPLNDRYVKDVQRRGLVFVALNANIERQFEFVQHAWITSPNFAGLYDEADPLLGGRIEGPAGFTQQDCPVRKHHSNLAPFVSVIGGEYFFLPSVTALRYLGNRTTRI